MKEIAEYYDTRGYRYSVCLADQDELMVIIGYNDKSVKFLRDDWDCNFLEEFAKILISIDYITCDHAFVDIVLSAWNDMVTDGETYMTGAEMSKVISVLWEEHENYILYCLINEIEIDLYNATHYGGWN